METSPNILLLLVATSIVTAILLITVLKLHAFIAISLSTLIVGLGSSLTIVDTVKAFQEGLGNTLGFIAVIVGLGTILGKLMELSGGTRVIAERFVSLFGTRRIHWTTALIGLVVGLPLFFGVGVVLLVPVLSAMAVTGGIPWLKVALPAIAGLSVAHGLVPPHPGPLLAIQQLNADLGKTLIYSVIVALPVALIAGPLMLPYYSKTTSPEPPKSAVNSCSISFPLAILPLLLPIGLMMLPSVVALFPAHPTLTRLSMAIGSPMLAMLIAVLVALGIVSKCAKLSLKEIGSSLESSLGPVANILLVVGAGGGFSKVLDVSGADSAIIYYVKDLPLSPLLFGWLIASAIRVAVGSATVAISLAAGLCAPITNQNPEISRELMVLALGAGSLILSHVNDGGFWFVKEYLGLTVKQTFATWTVLETAISISAIILILLLNRIIH